MEKSGLSAQIIHSCSNSEIRGGSLLWLGVGGAASRPTLDTPRRESRRNISLVKPLLNPSIHVLCVGRDARRVCSVHVGIVGRVEIKLCFAVFLLLFLSLLIVPFSTSQHEDFCIHSSPMQHCS